MGGTSLTIAGATGRTRCSDGEAAAGDDGLRHWGAGGALSALVHVLKNGDVKGVVRGRQDTAEAGGGTHRLLQPFPTKGTTTGRSAGARRALGLVLRGDAHFKKVLLKAHPHRIEITHPRLVRRGEHAAIVAARQADVRRR